MILLIIFFFSFMRQGWRKEVPCSFYSSSFRFFQLHFLIEEEKIMVGFFSVVGWRDVHRRHIRAWSWFWTLGTKKTEKILMWAHLIIGNEEAAFCSDILMRCFNNNCSLESLHFHPTETLTQGRKMLFLKALCNLLGNR